MYSNVTKVLVESRQGSNMLYLPLDKIMQLNNASGADLSAPTASTMNDSSSSGSVPSPATIESTSRSRDTRQRDRDSR
jgi:membrane protease subunit HflK